jgi:alpha-L-glutamate ligase-like protein
MIGALRIARGLHANGVVGINERNAEYTLPYNPRNRYPLVDDKLITKQYADKAGVAVPPLYGVVEIQRQVLGLAAQLAPYREFVVKPCRGSQGDGIVVVTGRSRNQYEVADGTFMNDEEMGFHVSNILSGIFSLGGQPDKALIEYRVNFDPVFAKITFRGVPDIRIIVFLGVPVMAMVRLPTRMSRGKANLHQGAVGTGVDMATGVTTTAVCKERLVDTHPDTGNPVAGVAIPNWGRLLDIAARSYELTGLGYQGIDIVLDSIRGPLVLELNARPGLAIQLANRRGLGKRLDAVRADHQRLTSVQARVDYARERFSAEATRPAGG